MSINRKKSHFGNEVLFNKFGQVFYKKCFLVNSITRFFKYI
jgi:hypothetical protein